MRKNQLGQPIEQDESTWFSMTGHIGHSKGKIDTDAVNAALRDYLSICKRLQERAVPAIE